MIILGFVMKLETTKKTNLKVKKEKPLYRLESRKDYFDSSEVKIIDNFLIDNGVLVIYCTKSPFCLGAALFDKKTNELIYRTANPILISEVPLTKLKITMNDGELEFLFNIKGKPEKEVFSIDYILGKNREKVKEKPIITPRCIIKKFYCTIYLIGSFALVYGVYRNWNSRSICHSGNKRI